VRETGSMVPTLGPTTRPALAWSIITWKVNGSEGVECMWLE
jgi:hypothetical protein